MNTLPSFQTTKLDLAIDLFNQLENYSDAYSNDFKAVLESFINDPSKDLKQMIEDIESAPVDAMYIIYDININILVSEILYPEHEENDQI